MDVRPDDKHAFCGDFNIDHLKPQIKITGREFFYFKKTEKNTINRP